MALLQIIDPLKNQQDYKETTNGLAVGIDLGTTYSALAIYEDGAAHIIKLNGEFTTPSVVALEGSKVVVGKPAENLLLSKKDNIAASTHSTTDNTIQHKGTDSYSISEHTHNNYVVRSVKRVMGKNTSDLESLDYKLLGLTTSKENVLPFVPEEVSAHLLTYMVREAEKTLQKKITQAVITVPAYFSEQSRQATKKAAEMAGLEVLRLVNEPTAAALAYGLNQQQSGTYLVYDFGGGTFDVSVISLSRGIFRVLSTAGDTNLGGDDIDMLIAEELSKTLELDNLQPGEHYNFNELLFAARTLKEKLSLSPHARATLTLTKDAYRRAMFTLNFTREQLTNLVKETLNKTLTICKDALEQANLEPSALSGIILVGGSSNLYGVQQLLQEQFKLKLYANLNPNEVVALGAAHHAANLSGKVKNALLFDLTPLSLGVETYGGACEKIIYRNSPLPITKRQVFTTFQNGQTAISFHVLQGERELAKDNLSLGKFSLKGLPPQAAGTVKVEVSFSLSVDGLLSVEAKELSTGVKAGLEINSTYDISLEGIETYIKESIDNAEADMQAKLLVDAKTKANQLLNMLTKILKEPDVKIPGTELSEIRNRMKQLEKAVSHASSASMIKEAMHKLNLVTASLAQTRLDAVVNKRAKLKL